MSSVEPPPSRYPLTCMSKGTPQRFIQWPPPTLCKPDMVYILDRGHGLHFYSFSPMPPFSGGEARARWNPLIGNSSTRARSLDSGAGVHRDIGGGSGVT